MTLKEAEAAALSILKQVMEEKVRKSVDQKCGRQAHGPIRGAPADTDISGLPSHSMHSAAPVLLPSPSSPSRPPPPFQITSTNVDIARVSPAYHLYTQAEVEEVMARI